MAPRGYPPARNEAVGSAAGGHGGRRSAAAGRRAGRRAAGGDRRRARAAAGADGGDRHARRSRHRELCRHRAAAPALRRRGGVRARSRARDAADADLRRPARPGSRGLHLGQPAQEPEAARRRQRPVCAAGAEQAGQGGLRAGHLPQRGRRPDPGSVQRRVDGARRAGRAGGQGRPGARPLPAQEPGAGQAARRAGQAARLRGVRQERDRAGAEVRHHIRAPAQRPAVRVADRLRRHEGPGRAQAALRLHLPQQEQRAHPGALPP
jgi:hypothetical protein